MLIGKKGSRLKEIQLISGASLYAQPNILPNSTERVMTITGDPEAIQIASQQIALQLSQLNPLYEKPPLILYEPLACSVINPAQMGLASFMPTNFPQNPQMLMMPFDFQAMQQHMQQMYGYQAGSPNAQFPIIPSIEMQQMQHFYGFYSPSHITTSENHHNLTPPNSSSLNHQNHNTLYMAPPSNSTTIGDSSRTESGNSMY